MRPDDDATTPIDSPWNRTDPRLSQDSPTDERYRSAFAPQFGRPPEFTAASMSADASQRIDAPWSVPNGSMDGLAGLDFARSPAPVAPTVRSRTPLFVVLGCAAVVLLLALVGGSISATLFGLLLFLGAIGTFVVRFLIGAVRALAAGRGGERRLLGRTGIASLAIGGASLAVLIAGVAMAPTTSAPAPIAAPVPTVSEVAEQLATTAPPVETAPPTTEAPVPAPIADPVEDEPAPQPEVPVAPEPSQPEEQTEDEAAPPASVYYSSCADAKASGAAPLHRGEPGYRSGLDRDNDGVACEN